ncbi:MAG: quinol:electron acceptor oxidoreductase subunit ActD [Planctomycetota bacterium]
MAEDNKNGNTSEDSQLVGLLAEFDEPEDLVHACNEARTAGFKKFDAYSPFPVHGIDPAIGIKRSILPFIVLGVALGACLVGLGMQFYTNGGSIAGISTDESPVFPGYAFKISGKPYFSLSANIPVTFEVIVLSSAFATFLGMWFLNGLPRLSNPIHRVSRFKRVTDDKFFLMIEASDNQFVYADTEAKLNQWGAVAVEECRQDLTDNKMPSWIRLAFLLGAILLMVPPVMIFRAMGMTNRAPRLHFMPDMDWQDKFKTQTVGPNIGLGGESNLLFLDNRSMRKPVEGSVIWGELHADTEMYQGIKKDYQPGVAVVTGQESVRTSLLVQQQEGDQDQAGDPPAAPTEDLSKYVSEFPEGITVDADFVRRGQQRFNIYCAACHGYSGNGDGLVNQRAVALSLSGGKAQWTSAKSLHDVVVKNPEKNPIGRIFETISYGRSTMGPYKDQIPAEDRWAIVAYVKALQETGIVAPGGAVASEDDESAGEEATSGEEDESVQEPKGAPKSESGNSSSESGSDEKSSSSETDAKDITEPKP